MNKRKEDPLEMLFQRIMEEMVSRGWETFRPQAAGATREKSGGVGDIFDMLHHIKEQVKEQVKQASGVPNEKNNHNMEEKEKPSEFENIFLREQIRLLKQQLSDKEEIIDLLKDQVKDFKEKPKTSATPKKKTT